MIVSTKGRYALRVMIDLAEHRSEKYVPLKEVAARQEISEIPRKHPQGSGAERLPRGPARQGRRLSSDPRGDQYTVGEILTLTEEALHR